MRGEGGEKEGRIIIDFFIYSWSAQRIFARVRDTLGK